MPFNLYPDFTIDGDGFLPLAGTLEGIKTQLKVRGFEILHIQEVSPGTLWVVVSDNARRQWGCAHSDYYLKDTLEELRPAGIRVESTIMTPAEWELVKATKGLSS